MNYEHVIEQHCLIAKLCLYQTYKEASFVRSELLRNICESKRAGMNPREIKQLDFFKGVLKLEQDDRLAINLPAESRHFALSRSQAGPSIRLGTSTLFPLL